MGVDAGVARVGVQMSAVLKTTVSAWEAVGAWVERPSAEGTQRESTERRRWREARGERARTPPVW